MDSIEISSTSAKRINEADEVASVKRQKPSANIISDTVAINGNGITAPINPPEHAQQWQSTINKVVKSVVAIRFTQVVNFDSDSAIVSEATGFVVDANRGIILTNRHVVCPGPFVGYAVFDNHEEAVVKPIYRDPVHDFGFLKFDPSKIKYMTITELKLKPELAKVGCEIRVVGNDAGEKLSILSGFISRLDRNAPDYGFMTYNDFNTEYIQAAASASGGSSGSPVIDIQGNTLALQAGGSSSSATDFFLPVYRVLRALKLVQAEKPITRGTIQVQWLLKPFDECRRLGLSEEAEAKARKMFPKIMSLLVAEVTLPKGPADSKIKEGDILISINDIYISSFITVDEILDDSVGNNIHLTLQRNGKYLEVDCKVQDLHSITPDRYLSMSGASFNDLSYQMARIYMVPVKGVFVSNASGTFSFRGSSKGWIIDSVDNHRTENLDKFIEVMEKIPDRKYVPIKYRHLSSIQLTKTGQVYIDRHWYGATLATRNDKTGIWDYKKLADRIPTLPLKPLSAKFIDLPNAKPGCAKLTSSFVMVKTTYPSSLDSYPFVGIRGYGLVVDASKGYVLVSRKYVCNDMCDITVEIAESVLVPAKVIFLHPSDNYAIIKYDPKLVDANVITPKFSKTPISRGEALNFIGFNFNHRVLASSTTVTDLLSSSVPYCYPTPRYRGMNLESIVIDSNICGECESGVLADDDGTIRGIWLDFLGEVASDGTDLSYKMGLDVIHLNNVLQSLEKNEPPRIKIIDAEFYAMTISSARLQGVSEKWIAQLEKLGDDRYQFFCALRVTCDRDALLKEGKDDDEENVNEDVEHLKVGDIILTINGVLVHRIKQLQNFPYEDADQKVNLKVVRNGKELSLDVLLAEVPTTNHYVSWCGAEIQEPHHCIRQELNKLPSQVYISCVASGSPAQQYGLSQTYFITHVNEVYVATLNDFIREIKKIKDESYCKLRVRMFENVPFAVSLKVNYHYFPTAEFTKNEEGKWKGITYDKENTVKKERVIQEFSF